MLVLGLVKESAYQFDNFQSCPEPWTVLGEMLKCEHISLHS